MGVKSCPCTYFSPICPARETERTPRHSSSGLTWNFAQFAATASAMIRSIEVGQKRCPCTSFPLSECEKSIFSGFVALPLRPPCSGASRRAENDARALLFDGAYAQNLYFRDLWHCHCVRRAPEHRDGPKMMPVLSFSTERMRKIYIFGVCGTATASAVLRSIETGRK